MKIRQGFVSNSSSSSFILKIKYLSLDQIYKIQNHTEEAGKIHPWTLETFGGHGSYNKFGYNEDWYVDLKEEFLYTWTSMDNFDMDLFLKEIGVPEAAYLEGYIDGYDGIYNEWADNLEEFLKQ